MGAGAAKRVSAVRWGVAGNIVVAWVLTLPAAAAIGAGTYGITRIFGTGAAGPHPGTFSGLAGPVLFLPEAILLRADVAGRVLRVGRVGIGRRVG